MTRDPLTMRLVAFAAVAGIAVGAVATAPLDTPTLAAVAGCTPNEVTICVEPGSLEGWAFVGSPSPSATVAPSASVGPTVSPSPAATPTPTLAPTPSPTASPTPGPTGSPVACGSSLQSVIDAAPAGSTVDLGACTYTAGASVNKALTLLRGTIVQGGTALNIAASDVTVDGTAFDGGNNTLRISGDRAKVLRSTFVRMRETSIRLNPGADDGLIEGNTILQTIGNGSGYSPISANDGGGGSGTLRNWTIRGNHINQGTGSTSWFGVEVWGTSGLVIEGNTFLGDSAQVSIPRSDGAIVRANTFGCDGCGSANFFWGIEISHQLNVQVRDNIVFGQGSGGESRAFIQLQTPVSVTVTGNRLKDVFAFFNAAGQGHTITDNCGGWTRFNSYSFSGPNITARNGPCP